MVKNTDHEFKSSKSSEKFTDRRHRDKYLSLLGGRNLEKVIVLKFLHFSCYEYRPGLIVLNDKNVMCINLVVHDQNTNEFLLVCEPLKVLRFDITLNSFEILKDQSPCVIVNINNLKSKETFDKIIAGGKLYIFADTLKISNLC